MSPRIDPVATAHRRLAVAKSEMDTRLAAMATLGHDEWGGAPFTVTVDAAEQALRNPECRHLAAEIAKLGRNAAVGLTLRFERLPSLADCGGDRLLRDAIADGSRIHAEVATLDERLAARLSEIADDPSWSVPLRMAAKAAAAGDRFCAIAPASLADEDLRTALIGNMLWRRDQPGSVDMITPGAAS